MRTLTLNNASFASDPGRIQLSHGKLRRLQPELYEPQGLYRWFGRLSPNQHLRLTHTEEHLLHGDSRAALVVSINPLLVAAYTDELDCIALLRFPQELAQEYSLQVGSRLLTVNLYMHGNTTASDLQPGPTSYQRYSNFIPLIAEFVSADQTRIEARKAAIAEAEWARTEGLAQEYLAQHGQRCRDGRPLYNHIPANAE